MENDDTGVGVIPVRPPGPIKVWFHVDGVMNTEPPRSVKFSIQEIPKDRYEDVVDHMSTYFVADEVMCQSLSVKDDPLQLDDLRRMWRLFLKQDISVAAFVDDPDGGKPIIAGVNVLCVDFKDQETDMTKFDFKSKKTRNMLHSVIKKCKEVDVFNKYGVEKCMYALGLSVHPIFRGQALGGHLLKARENIGREYEIPATSTAFTSIISQKLAARVGFEELLAEDYDQILDDENQPVFPNIKAKTLKVMGRKLY